jgi:hypothetical protein
LNGFRRARWFDEMLHLSRPTQTRETHSETLSAAARVFSPSEQSNTSWVASSSCAHRVARSRHCLCTLNEQFIRPLSSCVFGRFYLVDLDMIEYYVDLLGCKMFVLMHIQESRQTTELTNCRSNFATRFQKAHLKAKGRK